jgi:transcriptional regulator with XRE-family HTH domain
MTAGVGGPVSGRRRLRLTLRKARDARKYTQEQVAARMDWSLSKVIRIENGTVGISTNDLRALLNLYQVTEPATVAALVQLAKAGRSKPWWSEYRDYLSAANFRKLIDLEESASRILIFGQGAIPGLLQIGAYSRALLQLAVDQAMAEAELEARVAIRLRRQREVFDRPDPPAVSVVLDEAVVMRAAGGQEVMRDQLNRLLEFQEQPQISVRILPFSAGIYPIVPSFFILSFEADGEPDMVYTDTYSDEDLIEDPQRVTKFQETFVHLSDASLSEAESSAMLQKLAERCG